MRKILLVIDDYMEMKNLDGILKKVGFDTMANKSTAGFNDTFFGFHPDLVIATARSKNVDGFKLGEKVRGLKQKARIAVLYPIANPPKVSAEEKAVVDAFISSPVEPTEALHIIAQLLQLESKTLLEKYERFKAAAKAGQGETQVLSGGDRSTQAVQVVRGTKKETTPTSSSTAQSAARENRYAKFLEGMKEPVIGVVTKEQLKAARLKADAEDPLSKEDDSQDLAQREFVRALFKKV